MTVNCFLGPTLNYQKDRPLQYAIQIDDGPAQVVQPVINPRNPGSVDFASDPGGVRSSLLPLLSFKLALLQ